ncbi:AP3-complex subunit beta-A isoform X1 [Cucumis melo var. makuwa]|uniref:AP-3 complex subunit beta n=2 Tax=Cucumis melo TaxID=3656 RepID=A0A5A7U9W1_CUCMM|nr:AP3-complex subunit beta-A isoform X1 [Cucumis melo var. makuwa]TYK03539.1 AP3-complex subunit beta-A isoform X1 [Cucumis melo var. makuwa]
MFTQFGSTSDTLSKASTMVFRIGTDAHLYDDPEDVNIAPLLDSKFDSEKCEALKRLLALIAQGFDVSNFFPQVVKNVASQTLEVKKLVYLYLLHYAEKRPNEALLSINCFQKDLGDTNPLVRAWALRTMAGIRLHAIAPLALVAVRKGARDPSVYVRKCAANALPKLHDLRLEEISSDIKEIVLILLGDSSPGVVGAAAAAFASICPNELTLIGKNYRRLCEVLPDVEEWGQIILIGILLRYAVASIGLVRESIMYSLQSVEDSSSEKNDVANNFTSANEDSEMNGFNEMALTNMISRCYNEGPDEYLSRLSCSNEVFPKLDDGHFVSIEENDDIRILLQCTSPLLWSNNSAVVLAAAGVHWIMAPRENIKRIVKPLVFLLRSCDAAKYVVLCNIQVFAKAMPSLFAPHYEDFFICYSDSYQVKSLKLEILSSIATDSSILPIFNEFQDYIRNPNRRFAADTVAAIGLCAGRLPKIAKMCLDGLLSLIRQDTSTCDNGAMDEEAAVLTQAITSIKFIVIIQLIRSLDSVKVPAARAMIIWMVGEYSTLGDIIPRMLVIVAKYLARSFISEALQTKLQILNTMVKVLLRAKEEDVLTFKVILGYMLEVGKCDLNYDLRDRAAFIQKLLSSHLDMEAPEESLSKPRDQSWELAERIFGGQLKPIQPEPINYRFYLPGSLSQIVLHAAPGYEPLPKPCTLDEAASTSGDGAVESDSYETDNTESSSGSLDEEDSASDYSSQHSLSGSSGRDESYGANHQHENAGADPLIELSDHGNTHKIQNGASASGSAELDELMSKNALESWLNEQPNLASLSTSEKAEVRRSSARISIGNLGKHVVRKNYQLLDPATGNGLKVEYSFSSQTSSISPLHVCIEASFKNCSAEPMTEIMLTHEESDKVVDSKEEILVRSESSSTSNNTVTTPVSMENITSLEPDQTINRILEVQFNHHLLPMKLNLYCNGRKHPVKLHPDIGYFVRPLPMDIEAFTAKESQLPGMFEYMRRCTFTDHLGKFNDEKNEGPIEEDKFLLICKSLALKMLGNANIFLVSMELPVANFLDDATGLCLRFSAEILSNSIPCLVSLTVEGKCLEPLHVTVKVNCEETVFGLNLLNRIVNFLGNPSAPNQ